jgi:hypothetical protein
MIEEYVPGRELTVAVMDDLLAVAEIMPKTAFYDYDAKYAAGGSNSRACQDYGRHARRGDGAGRRAHAALLPAAFPFRFPLRRHTDRDRLIVLK